jgi:hypothetical protein
MTHESAFAPCPFLYLEVHTSRDYTYCLLTAENFIPHGGIELGVLGFLPREITSLKSPWNSVVFYLTG